MEPCAFCGEPIKPDEVIQASPFHHHECLVRSIVGSIGHQLRMCHCYGGTWDDPPELTLRESARLANEYFADHGLAAP